MSEFEVFGAKAKFNRKVELAADETMQLAVEEKIPLAPEHEAPAAEERVREQQIVNELLMVGSPAAAFGIARSHLERTLINSFTKATGQAPGLLVPIDDVIARLEVDRYITARMRRNIRNLLELGGKAMHESFKPSVESAREYVTAVQAMTTLIENRALLK